MTATGKIVFFTVISWLPILGFFYLPNAFWGIALKVLAGIFLVILVYNFILGPGSQLFGSAGVGVILNTVGCTIINMHPPQWVSFILWGLIIIGIGTCHKILKKMEKEGVYSGMSLYEQENIENKED